MAELTKRRGEKSGLYNRPYKDLYIYLLNGTVAEKEEKHLGAAFVGNWVEDDSSFLFFGQPADKEVDRLLGSCPELELIETHHFTYEQWQGGGLEPLTVDEFLVIANMALGAHPDADDSLASYDADIVDVNVTADCLNRRFDDCATAPSVVFLADETEALPTEYGLGQNYPNPFNPTTEFSFTLPKPSHVRLVVYNITGRVVTTVTEGQYSAGYHTVVWNASNTASGVYFYRLEADNFVASKKMVLLK